MTLPTVSAICPTFGRYPNHGHLVDLAVGCFLAQNYPGPRELVVLNDCPGQTLFCQAPGVRVVNLSTQVASLGEKFNLLLELARGRIAFPWEDDDVSLPHRISQGVRALGDAFDYFDPRHVWYVENHGPIRFDHNQNCTHHGSCYRRDALRYEPVSGDQDQRATAFARDHLRCAPPLTGDPATWSYLYRWGVSPWHLSGHKDTAEAYRRAPQGPPGRYEIVPASPAAIYDEIRARLAQRVAAH